MSVFSNLIVALWLASFSLATKYVLAQNDKLALLAIKSELTGDPQNALSSWNDSLQVCEWEGITCGRGHRRVTILDLRYKGLRGPISRHIGNMSFLKELLLYNNSFNGQIPQEIGRLFRLEALSLGLNSFVGEIPGNISNCSNLRFLYFPLNNLSGKIPMELGSLSKLVMLNLRRNSFSGGIPPSLGNLTSLQSLGLSDNPLLGGNIPNTFQQLRNLKLIFLSSCNLSGMFPAFWYSNFSAIENISIYDNQLTGNFHSETSVNIPNLLQFLVGRNQLSGHIPISLFNASKLQEIDIGDNQFIGKVPLSVGNLLNLKMLLVGGNNLGNAQSGDLDFLTSLTNCSHLQVLQINRNNFGGTLPASIGNFSNQLQQLYLSRNQIHGAIPPEIGNTHILILLTLSDNFLIDIIPMGIGNLRNLQVLYLDHNRLTGQIPSSMSNMSQLFDLGLSENNLEGSIFSALENQNLQYLLISDNFLTGNLTNYHISYPSRLISLDMSYNFLSGSIPSDIGKLQNLGGLWIAYNKLSGEIPPGLGSCSNLENLVFPSNFFDGPIPQSLSSVKGLQVLDLSSNNLSGEIPKELGKLPFLASLNLSFNLLEGEVPVGGVFGNSSAFSIAGNNKICGGISQLKLSKCHVPSSNKHGNTLALRVILGVVIPLFLVALFLIMYLRKRPKEEHPSELYMVDLRRVSYIDLHHATEGFSAVKLIGKGSYGSVYKGNLQQDESPVAVKVLNLMEHGAPKSFSRECQALREVRHRNLLKILTVCSSVDLVGNDFKALVFEFMPNGSLEKWLHPSSNDDSLQRSLNFYQRLTIAIDIASALNYLHNDSEKPIVHCDVKASNILLNEDMTAIVSDFGLAKFLSKSVNTFTETETSSVAMRGTIGYIPPEYGMGSEVSKQGDVYSYGILLLEMFTGKRPTDQMFKDGLSLHEFCKAAISHRVLDIVDTSLLQEVTGNISPTSVNSINECFNAIVEIGLTCSREQMDERMDIKQVLKQLHLIKSVLLPLQSY